MSEEIKDMIEPIPNWEFTYRYDGSRTCGKSYIQSLLDEKDKQIEDLQQKVAQLEKENKKLKYLVDDSNIMKAFIVEHNKVEQLENIIKETIDYVYKHIQEYDVDGTFTNLDEFDFIASPQTLLNILNKGDNNGK